MTLLYVVEGAAAGFRERRGLQLDLDPQTGGHQWCEAKAAGRHIHLGLTRADGEYARRIEDLMLEARR